MSTTLPPVLSGVTLAGQTNCSDQVYLDHLAQNIRRGLQQIKPQPPNYERVCLVGSGPSLAETEEALIALLREGAKLVTLNGAYHWALARHLQPATQVVIDARPSNVRFVQPIVPRCNYLVGSIVHPSLIDALTEADPTRVWLFHPVTRSDVATAARDLLDAYYLGEPGWTPCGGGTTVATRALYALRMLGYLRFDLFGIDSCWLGDRHHALPQPENDGDRAYDVTVHPGTAHARTFRCSGWHVKQLEDWLAILRVNGDHVLLHVHGEGLLAYVLRTAAEAEDVVVQPAA
jgi:hypothetical protein